jgi:uncharacterized membrane protein
MSNEINKNLVKTSTWKRLFFMAVFLFILGFVKLIIWFVMLFQVATHLLTGAPNEHALKLGQILAAYVYQVILYLTYDTDKMPFPFSDFAETIEFFPSTKEN